MCDPPGEHGELFNGPYFQGPRGSFMSRRYRIKFSTGYNTSLRFVSWDNGAWYLEKVLRYKYSSELVCWVKGSVRAKVVCARGIPFNGGKYGYAKRVSNNFNRRPCN